MALDIIAKLDTLVPDPSCVYEALEPILGTCETPENVVDRTGLAVRLALCEFSAAGIDFPAACTSPPRLTECTRLLESKPTWWTTFSGKYQQISLVCREYQPQFESRRVLHVFKEASKLYSEFRSEMDADFREFQRAKQVASDQLAVVTTDLVAGLNSIDHQITDLLGEAKSNHGVLLALTMALNSTVEDAQAQMAAVWETTSNLEGRITGLGQHLDTFADIMRAVQIQHEATADRLQASADHTSQVLQHADATLEDSAAMLKIASAIIKMLGVLVGPLGLVLIAVMAFLVMRSRPRHASTDVIFF